MTQVILGATSATFAVAGYFFFRFWRQTRDRFFLLFALAFWAYAVSRASLGFMDPANEDRIWLHVIRVAATLLILVAIIQKNVGGKRGAEDEDDRVPPAP